MYCILSRDSFNVWNHQAWYKQFKALRLSSQKVKARVFFCSVSRKYRRARRLFRNSSTAKATRNTCQWSAILSMYIHNIHIYIYCLAHVETPTAARVMAVKAKSCAGARSQFLYAESFDDGGRGHLRRRPRDCCVLDQLASASVQGYTSHFLNLRL